MTDDDLSKLVKSIKSCPDCLPDDLRQHMRKLADAWIQHSLRQRIAPAVVRWWDNLILKWADDSSLPLYVRHNKGRRGSELKHKSGRIIVPVDNSVAHWAFSRALLGAKFELKHVAALIEEDAVPVAMMFKTTEKSDARYKCTRVNVSLNEKGWKVCHIKSVGFRRKIDPLTHSLPELKAHFIRYMSPSNMFLVPRIWGGLGEMPDMIEAARAFLHSEAKSS